MKYLPIIDNSNNFIAALNHNPDNVSVEALIGLLRALKAINETTWIKAYLST